MTKYRKATLNGVRIWMQNELAPDFAIPQEHHVLPDGSRLDYSRCFDGASYAHCYGDEIRRYGAVIGTLADVVDGWPEDTTNA